jgi:hypothetical protein
VWTVAVTVATLLRVRWLERIVLPLAAVALAGLSGAAMSLLIVGGSAEGVAAVNIAAAIPVSQASSDTGRSDHQRAIAGGPTRGDSSHPRQKFSPVFSGRVAQEEDSNAVDQPSEVQAQSEPSASPEPHASPGVEPDAEEPSPEPTASPAPSADEEDEQAGRKVTLCHKAGSKNPKTISVGEGAVEEHLAHGDTLGVCP